MGNASLGRILLGLAVVFALGACHRDSGGGPSQPEVSFTFESSGTSLDEGDAPTGVTVVLRLLVPALTADAQVEVVDLGTGSATAGDDYAAFPPQTLTFPTGSVDGATQTVMLSPQDDAEVDVAEETIQLALQNPVGGALFGTQQFTVVLRDDEVMPAEFEASEGPTGVENALAYDQLLDLGTQAVGAGPNAGTHVRVTNGGGQPMRLDPPSLTGSHPSDFLVELEGGGLVGGESSALGSAALAAPGDEPAPLAALADDGGPGLAVRLDPAEVERLGTRSEARLMDLELPGLGPVTLELRRLALPLTEDSRLVIDGAEVAGGVQALVGDLQLWSGAVEGLAGSHAFLALTPTTLDGYVVLPEAADRLVHLMADGPGRARLLSEVELQALGQQPIVDFCAGERLVPGALGRQELGEPPARSGLTMANCRLALETDYQLFTKFASSAELTSYVTSLIAAVSDQYVTDVQASLSIAYLGIHTTSDDGWDTQENGGDAGDLLDEFRAAWSSNWPAEADLAHFLSGDALGGGVAYVDVLCSPGFGFGVSGSMNGRIDWGSWTGQPGSLTWDFIVVAHELGHNFGSLHTHDYCPPLDHCYSNCDGSTSCTRGTLMSYCHVSCGGLANIDLYFHPATADIMRASVAASCLEDVLLPGAFVQYRVRFAPLTATGVRNATVQFVHDAPNTPQPFRVRLTGTAN